MAAGHNSENESQTLKASGAAYLLADAAGAVAALNRQPKQKNVFRGLTTWFAGGAAAARYGNPKEEVLLRQQAIELRNYLKSQGVEIPENIEAQHALLKHPGFIEKIENFLYKHPSETLNAAFGVGAALLIKDGVQTELAKGKTVLPKTLDLKGMRGMASSLWMGSLVLAGALSGLLITEDKQAREKAKDAGAFSKAWAWVKENPLRLTGSLYLVNNLFTVNKAYGDFHDFKHGGLYQGKALKPHYFSGVMAASYVFANVMLALSSREQGAKVNFKPEQMSELERAAADILAAQPPEAQAQLLQGVSQFLADSKKINMPPEQLAKGMADRIANISKERLDQAVAQTHVVAQAKRQTKNDNATMPEPVITTAQAELQGSAAAPESLVRNNV